MLLTEHAKCTEHSELIHGAQRHVDDTTTESGNSLRSTSDPEGEAAHDHCLLAADRRDAVKAIVDARFTAARKIEASVRYVIADVAPHENAPRFQVAPKNSPPA